MLTFRLDPEQLEDLLRGNGCTVEDAGGNKFGIELSSEAWSALPEIQAVIADEIRQDKLDQKYGD